MCIIIKNFLANHLWMQTSQNLVLATVSFPVQDSSGGKEMDIEGRVIMAATRMMFPIHQLLLINTLTNYTVL